jgi:hypothetical protein
MYKNVTHWHPRHTVCASVSGVTKYAGTASCAIVSSQWTGGAVSEGEVLFSVLFIRVLVGTTEPYSGPSAPHLTSGFRVFRVVLWCVFIDELCDSRPNSWPTGAILILCTSQKPLRNTILARCCDRDRFFRSWPKVKTDRTDRSNWFTWTNIFGPT